VTPSVIVRLIEGRVGKTLSITFRSGEVVNAKIISARSLEEDADFYFIDLDRAPAADDDTDAMRHHVYSGTFDEVLDVEVPP
jgi:hypothetical protein